MKLPIGDWSLHIWRSADAICGLLLVVAWIAGNSHFEHLAETSPRLPNPVTGEIVPVHWKSVVVYMTQSDAQFDRWFTAIGFGVCFALVAIAFWRRYRNRQPN